MSKPNTPRRERQSALDRVAQFDQINREEAVRVVARREPCIGLRRWAGFVLRRLGVGR